MSPAIDAPDVDFTIRSAEMSDAPSLAALMGELGYETNCPEMEARLQTILVDSRYKTFVAVSGGEVCGMIGTFCLSSYEHNDLSGRILALVVTDRMRGRGVGHQLMAAAEQDFAERNIRRVAVNTRFEREEAHKFYEQLGYARNGWRFVKSL
jgi:GNAT superfamily N-acetyltransferase